MSIFGKPNWLASLVYWKT